MSTVPVFAPSGELGDIPADRLADAVKAGFKPGVHMKTADGQDGVIPADRTPDAVKAGMSIVPIQDQPIKHPGFWSTLSGDLRGMASSAYHGIVDYDPLTDPKLPDSQKNAIVTAQQNAAAAQNQARTQAHGRLYSLGATAAEMAGTNVSGMEQSAEQGDVGGVYGHAAAPVAAGAIAEGALRAPGALKAGATVARAPVASALRTAADVVNPDITGLVSPRLAHAQRLAGRIANVLEPAKPPANAPLASTTAAQASVLADIPVKVPAKVGPPTTTLADLKPADVQAAANKAVGYEPPKPGQPIAQRPTNLPPGHTPALKASGEPSEAVASYKYDPDARELEVHPTSGTTTYRYGDVSPEQAAAFQNPKSVGKAWQTVRQSGSPLVAKRVNGKWVPVKPAQPTASLGDLTDILQQSLQQARQR